MGYSDRDYYREDATDAAGISASSMVIRLIVVNVVLFLADWITTSGKEHWLFNYLAVSGDTVSHPQYWYQFLTAGFLHSHQGLWHILGNMFGLYVFGRAIEERLGGKEFLRFYLLAIVLGNVAWGLRQYFLVGTFTNDAGQATWGQTFGAAAGVTALMLLFCLYYPRAMIMLFFVIPTPAWLVGLLIIASDVSGVMSQVKNLQHVGFDNYAVGCVFTLAYWYFGWNFGRLPGMRTMARMFSSVGSLLRPRADLRAHQPEQDYEDLEEEADRLLAKVGEKGEASLTPKERKVLEDYSRWMRNKHR